MRSSVTSTVLSTAWRNGVLSLDHGAPAATQRLRDKPRRAQRPWVCAIFVLAQVSSMKTRRHPPRWCLHRPGVFVEVETVLLACIQAFLQFSQGIMRQLVAEAAFRDMRIGETCR